MRAEADDGQDGFRSAVAASRLIDPMPTFERLSETTGTAVADLIHHALVRWASAGAEALMSVDPPVLRELAAASRAEDWPKVAGMIAWLEAGLDRYGSG